MTNSRLILPGERRPVIAAAADPAMGPSPLDVGRLAEVLMARGVRAELAVGVAGDRVQVLASCGPIRIPMAFDVAAARGIIGHLAAAIDAVEQAPPAAPVPDTGPDHPGLPFLPSEASTDA